MVVDLTRVPDASPSFRVLWSGGSVAQGATVATVDPVNTALSAAAAAGAQTLAVDSTTGIEVGRRYLLGAPEAQGGEWVTVKSVDSATALTLARRLRRAALDNTTLRGTRVTCAIAAATGASVAEPGLRLELTYAVALVAQPKVFVPFHVTRYVPVSWLNAEDLRDADPLFDKFCDGAMWLPGIVRQAFDRMLSRVWAKKPPGSLVGTVDLTLAHSYLTRAMVLEANRDSDVAAHVRFLHKSFGEELDAALGQATPYQFDDDQSGATDHNERWNRGVRVSIG